MNRQIDTAELSGVSMVIDPQLIDEYNDSEIKNLKTDQVHITTEVGEIVEFLDLINNTLNKKFLSKGTEEIMVERLPFPNARLQCKGRKDFINISGVEISGFSRQYTTLDSDYFENKVWLIMKLLFEKKQFNVTTDCSVVEPTDKGIIMHVGQHMKIKMVPIIKNFEYTINRTTED